MSDYIKREDALKKLCYSCSIHGNGGKCSKCEAYKEIQNLPSADVVERKKGKWNFIGDNMFECTSCGVAYTTQQLNALRNYETDPYAPSFCPNCGADMRGISND